MVFLNRFFKAENDLFGIADKIETVVLFNAKPEKIVDPIGRGHSITKGFPEKTRSELDAKPIAKNHVGCVKNLHKFRIGAGEITRVSVHVVDQRGTLRLHEPIDLRQQLRSVDHIHLNIEYVYFIHKNPFESFYIEITKEMKVRQESSLPEYR